MSNFSIRRTEFDDIRDLSQLVSNTGGIPIYKATFGPFNFNLMIENSYLSLIVTNEKESKSADYSLNTIGFISVNDGLTLINDPDSFDKIIAALNSFIPITTSNAIFINFYMLDELAEDSEKAGHEMVKEAFSICTNTDYMVWVCPVNYCPADFVLRTFSQIKFDSESRKASPLMSILDGFKVLFVHRSQYLPKLLVREARVEDNDDLIPILQNSNPDILVGQQNSFFLADLIQSQDQNNSFYVGLKQRNTIAGMLATSLDVNVNLITKIFDIDAFPDIIIRKEERPLPPPLLIAVVGDIRLLDYEAMEKTVTGYDCIFVDAENMDVPLPTSTAEAVDDDDEEGKTESKHDGAAAAPTTTAPQPSAMIEYLEQLLEQYQQDRMDNISYDSGDNGNSSNAPAPPVPMPPAIIVFGYPRDENEAYERLNEVLYRFDCIIEVHNTSEDAEEDEDDEFMQHHLDALEVLREQYYNSTTEAKNNAMSGGDRGGTTGHHHHHHHHHKSSHGRLAIWRKVSVDGADVIMNNNSRADNSTAGGSNPMSGGSDNNNGGDNMNNICNNQLNIELTKVLDHRNAKIEAQRAKDREEPPKANAFAVTVLCMQDDYASRAEDLLGIAFEDHSQQEYCLYMVSNTRPPPAGLTRYFTYVKTRPGVSFDQSLYLMHRSALLVNENMTVSRLLSGSAAGVATMENLEAFAQNLRPQREQTVLLDAAKRCIQESDVALSDNPEEVCFLIQIGTGIRSVVGVVVLSRRVISNDDVTWLRANYHLDDLVCYDRHRVRSQAAIIHWMLDPVYSPYTRRIIQQIMRLYGKSLLYFQTPRDVPPPKEILQEFVPLRPRRRMQAISPNSTGTGSSSSGNSDADEREIKVEFVVRPSSVLHSHGTTSNARTAAALAAASAAAATAAAALGWDCPLFCITKHHLSRPKEVISKRVVVAGGSSHAYALIETICSTPYLYFPNIFLIMDRLPAPLKLVGESVTSASAAAASFYAHLEDNSKPSSTTASGSSSEESKYDDDYSGCLSVQDEQYPLERELYALGLGFKVNVIRGHITDIDRENRAVVVSDELAIEYDVLVLSTATQDSSTKLIPSLRATHPNRCADAGIFSLGNPSADLLAMRYMRKRYAAAARNNEDIVVSGSGLPAFAAVAKLLKAGFAPTRITMVVPEPEGRIAGVPEKNITDPLLKGLLSVGVKMCWGFIVAEVYLSKAGFLESVELQRTIPLIAPSSRKGTAAASGSNSSIISGGGAQESKYSDDAPPSSRNNRNETPQQQNIVLSCMTLLCCMSSHAQQCDRNTFCAINDCGLVFDGGLVVDTNFRTVDPSIYAVSDYTRFSRVRREALPHSSFNPRELGSYVALKILEQELDSANFRSDTTTPPPQRQRSKGSSSYGYLTGMSAGAAHTALYNPYISNIENMQRQAANGNNNVVQHLPLPQFSLPRTVSCELPNKLFYFRSRLPVTPPEAVSYLTYNQSTQLLSQFSSGTPRNRNCELKTDSFGTVVSFTYIGEDPIECRNLSLIPGMHESFLSSSLHMHTKGYIHDWITFFRQEWAIGIYQDSFPLLVKALRKSLASDKGMMMLINRVFERAEHIADDQDLADFRKEELTGAYGELVPETTLRTIEAEVTEYLKEHRALLPQFTVPHK